MSGKTGNFCCRGTLPRDEHRQMGNRGVLAGIVMTVGASLFRLLLGPNDVMPPYAAFLAATLILLTAIYQPSVLLLSYASKNRAVLALTGGTAILFAISGIAILWMRPSLEVTLLSFTVYYALVALAFALCFRILKWHARFCAADLINANGQRRRNRPSDSNRTGER